MMMNEEKQPVDVSKQPIVFGGIFVFKFFLFFCFYYFNSDVIKTISCFIFYLCLFVKTNRGRYIYAVFKFLFFSC